MIDFGRAICGDLAAAERREWLVTNGIGGFASGTVAGTLTRCYHGLLIAALDRPLGRTLLLTRLDEYAAYGGRTYPLFTNRWAEPLSAAASAEQAPIARQAGAVEPHGFQYLERFHLEGTTPVWNYALADALLRKRIWMQPGANVTYVCYTLERASAPLSLSLKALANYRDHHGSTQADELTIEVTPAAQGLCCIAEHAVAPLFILSDRAEALPQQTWYRDYFLTVEQERGLVTTDDHLYAGLFSVTLAPSESLTMVASTDPEVSLDGAVAYALRQRYEAELLSRVSWSAEPIVRRLALAADQFIVERIVDKIPRAAASRRPGASPSYYGPGAKPNR